MLIKNKYNKSINIDGLKCFKKWKPILDSLNIINTHLSNDISIYFEYYSSNEQLFINHITSFSDTYLPNIAYILSKLKLEKCRINILNYDSLRKFKYNKLGLLNNKSNILFFNKKFRIKIYDDCYISKEQYESIIINSVSVYINNFINNNEYYVLYLNEDFFKKEEDMKNRTINVDIMFGLYNIKIDII